MSIEPNDLPDSLSLDEAFRAAFYMVLQYLQVENEPNESLVLLAQYLWSDPARWSDWKSAVARGLSDQGLANPDHDAQWQERPEWPVVGPSVE
jgi:hypothetical protein